MTRPAPESKVPALKQTISGFQRRNECLEAENKRLRQENAELRRLSSNTESRT